MLWIILLQHNDSYLTWLTLYCNWMLDLNESEVREVKSGKDHAIETLKGYVKGLHKEEF